MRTKKEIEDRLDKLIKLEQQEAENIMSEVCNVLSCIERLHYFQCQRQMLEWVLNKF